MRERLDAALAILAAAAEIHPDGVEWEPQERVLALGQESGPDRLRWMVLDDRGPPRSIIRATWSTRTTWRRGWPARTRRAAARLVGSAGRGLAGLPARPPARGRRGIRVPGRAAEPRRQPPAAVAASALHPSWS